MNRVSDGKNIAAALFGEVPKAKATGGHRVNPQKLLEPLEGPASVVRSFCTGCGNYLELSWDRTKALAEKAKIELPPSLEKWYFETESCGLCDGKGERVFLKPIQ